MDKIFFVMCMFLIKNVSANPVIENECPAGFVLWPGDSKCHRVYSQGPCQEDEVLVPGPNCAKFEDEDEQEPTQTVKVLQGPCREDEVFVPSLTGSICTKFEDEGGQETEKPTEVIIPKSQGWTIGSILSNSANENDNENKVLASWLLPVDENVQLTQKEESCLSKEQIYWPVDHQCYSLLTQGPCPAKEWLVLRNTSSGDQVVCADRPCPCDPAAPDLCEVEVENSPCQCKVALAAAQDGICEIGEQLLVNPFGFGECGCISSPPHTSWPPDGRCYPVYSRGPCQAAFILTISDSSLEPTCQPSLCPEGKVLFEGKCHYLGYQGACEELEILTLDSDTLEPRCVLNTSKVKRVYDIIPNNRFKGFITDGPLSNGFKVRDCKIDSNGKCRKKFFVKKTSLSRDRNVKLYVKQRSPRKYLNWLKSFRRSARRNGK
eukprot:GFUD01003063.1.p1 GENE.GFUD01003063.1~~GFUD01003063.1.p1  ORF type:complete len:434 (-),score=89.18 GFUD01003063.1:213-1514(-)